MAKLTLAISVQYSFYSDYYSESFAAKRSEYLKQPKLSIKSKGTFAQDMQECRNAIKIASK